MWCSWTQRNIIHSNLNVLLWEMQLKILVAKCLPFCLITHWQWMSYQRTISLSTFVTRAFAVLHYSDVIMSGMASQISSLTIVYSTVHSSGADQRKHQSSVSQVFVRGIHPWPMNQPVTSEFPAQRASNAENFPFDDVIMNTFRLKHNGRQFANIFKCIFLMKKVEFGLKFHWSLFLMGQLMISQCEKIFNLHDILTPASKSKHCNDILTPPEYLLWIHLHQFQ